jgi:hypothetical protein
MKIRWNESGVLHVRAGDLMTRMRLRIGDMQKKKLSDYELLIALNNAVRMLWIALAENFSTIPRITAILPIVNGTAPLPKDFYSLASIQKGAAVNGFFVESDEPNVEICYNRLPSSAANADDAVEIPESMIAETVEAATAVMTGNMESAVNIVAQNAQRVSQKREHAAIPNWRPFS